ncbi:hypothetical protein DIS12_06935 [Leuconostoc citreum]|nr:hypothetical protein DIS12_06935 [Leuconostoc citreum]
MTNNATKVIYLSLLLCVTLLGLILSIHGATELIHNVNNLSHTSVVLDVPITSKLSGWIMWLSFAMFILYIFLFKERKRNLFWMLISFIGIIIFSITSLIYVFKNKEKA